MYTRDEAVRLVSKRDFLETRSAVHKTANDAGFKMLSMHMVEMQLPKLADHELIDALELEAIERGYTLATMRPYIPQGDWKFSCEVHMKDDEDVRAKYCDECGYVNYPYTQGKTRLEAVLAAFDKYILKEGE